MTFQKVLATFNRFHRDHRATARTAVSLANVASSMLSVINISQISNKRSSGISTLPWGTPAFMIFKREKKRRVFKFLFDPKGSLI